MESLFKILSEISKNVKQGLDTVFTRIQNCFIIFEDNNPYDDSLLETKIVLKTYEKANIETFIAALSVKESLQNFEIYQKIFEVLGETYLSSEYLSIKTHGIKDLIESPIDKKIASIDFVKNKLTSDTSNNTYIFMENLFKTFSTQRKKQQLLMLISDFTEKIHKIKKGSRINEINIFMELGNILDKINVLEEKHNTTSNMSDQNDYKSNIDIQELLSSTNSNITDLKSELLIIYDFAQNIDIFDNKKLVNTLKELTTKEIELLGLLLDNVKDKKFIS